MDLGSGSGSAGAMAVGDGGNESDESDALVGSGGGGGSSAITPPKKRQQMPSSSGGVSMDVESADVDQDTKVQTLAYHPHHRVGKQMPYEINEILTTPNDFSNSFAANMACGLRAYGRVGSMKPYDAYQSNVDPMNDNPANYSYDEQDKPVHADFSHGSKVVMFASAYFLLTLSLTRVSCMQQWNDTFSQLQSSQDDKLHFYAAGNVVNMNSHIVTERIVQERKQEKPKTAKQQTEALKRMDEKGFLRAIDHDKINQYPSAFMSVSDGEGKPTCLSPPTYPSSMISMLTNIGMDGSITMANRGNTKDKNQTALRQTLKALPRDFENSVDVIILTDEILYLTKKTGAYSMPILARACKFSTMIGNFIKFLAHLRETHPVVESMILLVHEYRAFDDVTLHNDGELTLNSCLQQRQNILDKTVVVELQSVIGSDKYTKDMMQRMKLRQAQQRQRRQQV